MKIDAYSFDSQIIKISEDYFDYMAKSYPVMCLSDEFYFFPRVKKAVKFLNLLDSLDEQKIKQDISYIKNLKTSLERFDSKDMGLETQIDSKVLNQSMSTFLREFEEIKIWRIDPNLYLKVLLLGIDQTLSRFSFLKSDIDDILMSRIAQIPRLLNEAKNNLKKIPHAHLEVATEVVNASIDYFKKEINAVTKKALESLEDFKRFLIKRSSRTVLIKSRQRLEDILEDSFSYKRSLEEIFEIASEEYRKTLEQLEKMAKKAESGKSWQRILSAYRIEIHNANGLVELYSSQIQKIRNFFKDKGVITIPRTQNILVRLTPQFMKPLRASASYSSPVTDDSREPAYFYVTPYSNVHNEYIFMTAHETYPGHHLLDSIRRRIANPIRQQIESALFYEGWASYAERLIDELGYVKDLPQRLLGLKRQAWRAVRAMLDAGIRINKLKMEDAQRLLKDLGYAPKIVKFMLRHYVLSPGYQLCYTIGKFEIDKLKRQFSTKLGVKEFHDLLLEGGQIPFDLIEKRMQSQLCKKDS